MAQPTACTPLHVLDHAIEVLSQPDGYVVDVYHARYDPTLDEEGHGGVDGIPGMVGEYDLDKATAHCAIGGVEHAIWKVCKCNVVNDRQAVAYSTENADMDDPVLTVYRTVMVALNSAAMRLYQENDVEDVSGSHSKEAVLDVFAAARARLVAERAG